MLLKQLEEQRNALSIGMNFLQTISLLVYTTTLKTYWVMKKKCVF